MRDSRVIKSYELLHGHALSATAQPLVWELINEFKDLSRSLVIVVGAGASMEVGLPSWTELVDEIAAAFVPASMQESLKVLTNENVQRRGLMTVALAGEDASGVGEEEMVRHALYRGGRQPRPGPLVNAITRLVQVVKQPTRIITTNYDTLLEEALSRRTGQPVRSYSLDGNDHKPERSYKAWAKLTDTARFHSVLHVHGRVASPSTKLTYGPIILTEADYLTNGRRVVDALAAEIQDSLTIFVGLSMTDINLLGAARRVSGKTAKGTKMFALSTPTIDHPNLTRQQCAETAAAVARCLELEYGIQPILLKTYAQVVQLVSDLSLAYTSPKRFVQGGQSSLRYGSRFCGYITQIYDGLAVDKATGRPSPKKVGGLSREFHLRFSNEITPLLNEFRSRYRGEVIPDENFGCFLWLRDYLDTVGDSFGLRLILNTSYTHFTARTGERVEPVTATSPYAAVQAVHRGQFASMVVRGDPGRSQTWKSSFAWPLQATGTSVRRKVSGDFLDQLTIGSISLNSSAPRDPRDEDGRRSIIGCLTEEEQSRIAGALVNVVKDLLS